MSGLFGNNVALLQALGMLAPEVNVRVALVNLVDFLADLQPGDSIERDDIFEVIAENIIWLHDHVGSDDEHGVEGEELEFSMEQDLSLDEALKKFRAQLGMKDEED